ncbi:MAG TPA: maltotransferase domain-containing protein, partial [Ilumatobacteraceae bacterium]
MSQQQASRPLRYSWRSAKQRPERLTITSVAPEVSGGTYPAKHSLDDVVEFSAVIVCDGTFEIGAQLQLTDPSGEVTVIMMNRHPGYKFAADVVLSQLGTYEFVVDAWIDRAATLRSRIARKRAAGQLTANEEDALANVADHPMSDRVHSSPRQVFVDRRLASFAAWYEFFPRSTTEADETDHGGDHNRERGTLRSAIDRLDYIASLGFDVAYLPPIHPIGRVHRKGVNNAVTATPADVGSPWAIGAAEGGHCAIHPELGTFADFDELVEAAGERGIEIAMDIAFQCSPDHPWVTEHPEWFEVRADGSIAYAENPPKLYQDIVPFNFDCAQWRELWSALADVVRFWHGHGVRVFRVDNPHTKPFPFWEWLIAELHEAD